MIGSDLRMKGQGIGSVHQFVCARCNNPRPTTGRKFARWRGMKTYICGECATAIEKDRKPTPELTPIAGRPNWYQPRSGEPVYIEPPKPPVVPQP